MSAVIELSPPLHTLARSKKRSPKSPLWVAKVGEIR
jgi:hypothetical protein